MKTYPLSFSIILLLGLIATSSGQEIMLPVSNEQDAYLPCVAYGKDIYLVCWQSGRLAKGDLRKGVIGESDIVGVRVGRDGKVIDTKPIVIATDKNKRQSPRVAFGGGVFLVVWHDLRNNKDWDIFAARVSPEGKVLDPQGIAVCSKSNGQALPRVAWDGQAFQIVWQDYRSGDRYEVYGARVSPEGKVLDEGGNLLVTQKDRHRFNPVVAPAGEGKSFVIWNGDIRLGTGTIAGGLFLKQGQADQSVAIESGGRKHGPGFEWVPLCLAQGPKSYLIAWTTDNTLGRDARPAQINAMILDPEGKQTATLLVGGKEQRIRDPEAAWDGEAFVTVWHEATPEGKQTKSFSDAVFTSRITPEGKVSGTTRLAGSFSAPAAQACVASDGAGVSLVAYEQHPDKPEVPIQIAIRILKSK